jgi:hypothetical protein
MAEGEVSRLQAGLAEERRRHHDDVQAARAELAGVKAVILQEAAKLAGERVSREQEKHEALRQRVVEAEETTAETVRRWHRIYRSLYRLLRDVFGFSAVETMEVILFLSGGSGDTKYPGVDDDGDPVAVEDSMFGTRVGAGLSREDVLRIQAARGSRSHRDVVRLLKDRIRLAGQAS